MSRTNTLQIAYSRVKWRTNLSRQNHQNWTAGREIEQRSARGITLAMWNMALTKMKAPTTIAKVYNSRICCAIGVSTDTAFDSSMEYRPRCRSVCRPTIGHSTATVYRPTVNRYLVVTLPSYHRRNTDTPLKYHRLSFFLSFFFLSFYLIEQVEFSGSY